MVPCLKSYTLILNAFMWHQMNKELNVLNLSFVLIFLGNKLFNINLICLCVYLQ